MHPRTTAPAAPSIAGRPSAQPAWRARLADLPPGYFGLVMATGIVSLMAHDLGWHWVARWLFRLNVVAYVVLWLLTLLRVIYFPRRCCDQLLHDPRSVAFLTQVAATCVLGSQFAVLTGWARVALGLWLFGCALWVVLNYTFLMAATTNRRKPRLESSLDGSWLLLVVAIESVSVLGTLVAPSLPSVQLVLFVSLATCLAGAMLYLLLITLILHRWLFFPLHPRDLRPSYWINMGATAITALAGARLLQVSGHWTLLDTLTPFLTGFTCLFWAMGSWWIPLLLLTGLWRHIVRRFPLAYDAEYWALVFPLGMYPEASFHLAQAAGLAFLGDLARVFGYVALAAWVITFSSMLASRRQDALA